MVSEINNEINIEIIFEITLLCKNLKIEKIKKSAKCYKILGVYSVLQIFLFSYFLKNVKKQVHIKSVINKIK